MRTCDGRTALGDPKGVNQTVVKIELSGEIIEEEPGKPVFYRGIRTFPKLGAMAHRIRANDLRAIYSIRGEEGVEIGSLTQNPADSRHRQHRRAHEPPLRGLRLDRRREDRPRWPCCSSNASAICPNCAC